MMSEDQAFRVGDFEFGHMGTEQTSSSIAMTPEGSFLVAWKQYDAYTSGGGPRQLLLPLLPGK